jgi:ubiquinone/menaquinone biosynthesis C-methylase UbiE
MKMRTVVNKNGKELAYIYDLCIVPTWRECFDSLFNEKLGLPESGRVLDVNCGTGGHALEMAATLANKGDVTAVDENAEMIGLAQAKAIVAKLQNINFLVNKASSLTFPDNSFDLVVCDASLTPPMKHKTLIRELVRVAKPGATVVLNVTSRGSFDEFFSIFWEALYECRMADEMLGDLEGLIKERPTVSETEVMLREAGLMTMQAYQKKEEFFYETAEHFFTAPLIENFMLEKWFSILPRSAVKRVREALERIIDRERGGYSFDVSIKATMIKGEKRGH